MTSSPPSSLLAEAVSAECPASPDGNYGEGLRSLWHLSRHLTARADDNHAAPSQESRRKGMSPPHAPAIQARVRFLAYHRIKPHVPPLVRAPVNSFDKKAHSGHPSFTVRTTRVSNPVRYPHLRASASVMLRHAAFAIGVLRDIYAFHRYTTNSAYLPHTQVSQFALHGPG